MASPGRSSPVTVPCQEGREPVATGRAAVHVAGLGLSRRELAAAVGCSVGTASRLARPGNRVRREPVERVLALHAGPEIPVDAAELDIDLVAASPRS